MNTIAAKKVEIEELGVVNGMADLAKAGIRVIAASKLNNESQCISVMIETVLPENPCLTGLCFEWKTRRGTLMYAHDFVYDTKTKILRFDVSAEPHKSFFDVFGPKPYQVSAAIIATTFIDLCWLAGEGTKPITSIEVATPIREEANLGDLTWVMPSKFIDDFVEMMHSLNSTALEGILEHSVVYGPYPLDPLTAKGKAGET